MKINTGLLKYPTEFINLLVMNAHYKLSYYNFFIVQC